MVHGHPVVDYDNHFIIDPVTRDIDNAENKKTVLIQNDHNSERFSFELDKLVEGHDMTKCNKVEVHYINTATTSRLSRTGVYEVDDLQIAESDKNKIVFTWLVSENATYYAGTLNFLILFACVQDNVCTYKWHTSINKSMTIAVGMNNGEAVTSAPYPDILEQWREKLFSKNYAYEDAVANGFGGTEEDWYNAIVGAGNAGTVALEAKTIATEAKNAVSSAYSPNNAPPYPVKSVNGKTGAVIVDHMQNNNVRVAPHYSYKSNGDYSDYGVTISYVDDNGKNTKVILYTTDSSPDLIRAWISVNEGEYVYTPLFYTSLNTPPSYVITTGGSVGQICAVNANGTISPNARTIDSLGTGATYSLNGTTLTITTL